MTLDLHIEGIVVGIAFPDAVERGGRAEIRQGLARVIRAAVRKIGGLGSGKAGEVRLAGGKLAAGEIELVKDGDVESAADIPLELTKVTVVN